MEKISINVRFMVPGILLCVSRMIKETGWVGVCLCHAACGKASNRSIRITKPMPTGDEPAVLMVLLTMVAVAAMVVVVAWWSVALPLSVVVVMVVYPQIPELSHPLAGVSPARLCFHFNHNCVQLLFLLPHFLSPFPENETKAVRRVRQQIGWLHFLLPSLSFGVYMYIFFFFALFSLFFFPPGSFMVGAEQPLHGAYLAAWPSLFPSLGLSRFSA